MAAPKENKNAEKWTQEKAEKFFNDSLELSKNKDYDFLGEIARDLGEYIELYDHLISRFEHLQTIKKRILSNCAANCYSNGKKGDIIPSMAIMNLKSNHGWTDRVQNDVTTNGKDINTNVTLTPQEIREINEALEKDC